MTVNTVKARMRDWFKAETGLKNVFWSRQDEPRPGSAGPAKYGTILFLGNGRRVGGIDELRWSSGSSKFNQEGLRTAIVSLNIVGDGANELMSQLRDSVDRPDVVEQFHGWGFSIVADTDPLDLSDLEDIKYKERSQMDVTVMYPVEYETQVQPIESVDIEYSDSEIGDIEFSVEGES